MGSAGFSQKSSDTVGEVVRYDDNYVSKPGKSWWWVVDDDYVVQRLLRPGYEKLSAYSVDWWLPWSSDQVIVQRRMIGTNVNPVTRDPN